MDTLDKIIKKLEEAKTLLQKNANMSYGGSTPNEVAQGTQLTMSEKSEMPVERLILNKNGQWSIEKCGYDK
jgi:hypothetical protein